MLALPSPPPWYAAACRVPRPRQSPRRRGAVMLWPRHPERTAVRRGHTPNALSPSGPLSLGACGPVTGGAAPGPAGQRPIPPQRLGSSMRSWQPRSLPRTCSQWRAPRAAAAAALAAGERADKAAQATRQASTRRTADVTAQREASLASPWVASLHHGPRGPAGGPGAIRSPNADLAAAQRAMAKAQDATALADHHMAAWQAAVAQAASHGTGVKRVDHFPPLGRRCVLPLATSLLPP